MVDIDTYTVDGTLGEGFPAISTVININIIIAVIAR